MIFFLMLIGLLAGVLSGIVGVGGGVIMVPLAVFLLGMTQHEAQGTSLAVLAIPVTLVAALNYYKAGHIEWRYPLIMAVFFIVGGYFGSKIALSLDQLLLKRIFGAVMLIVSIKLIFFSK